MADDNVQDPGVIDAETREKLEELEHSGRKHTPKLALLIGLIGFCWSLFQLWIASPLPFMYDFGIIIDVPARGIHLSFALLLVFLMFPAARRLSTANIPLYDVVLALVGVVCASYLFWGYDGLVERQGILWVWDINLFGSDYRFPFEALLGGIGMVLLLEATRRSIGIPLVIVAGAFLIYSIFGQDMPEIISHKGVSPSRLIGYQWLGGEGIFGIAMDVSVSFVYLFVLFGALLDRAGAGKYFLDLAFAMAGRFRGGPAKAAILGSGMMGMISGSSIANVATTGIFTIPVMRRTGMPAVKAGAIEVAASTNGQLMPPVMGAAAFVIAEFIGISYFDVIVAAFIPAVISYLALLYISHLEALKLGLAGMPREEIPPFVETFKGGIHFLVPIAVLIYLLMVERWTPASSVFYSILVLVAIIVGQEVLAAARGGGDAGAAFMRGLMLVYDGLVGASRNMVNIAVAIATAGIIVGAVSSTGLNNALVGVVEALSGGNVYILLGLTAVLCLILGMGLPTTANYLVVASLLAGVLVELGNAAGLVLPLIAVHLYVFFFGLMADSTPPVCLAAFAASAISRANPMKTGVQSFLYDIRTSMLPLVFIFNTELLLVGVTSVWHGLMIFCVSLIAILAFSSVTQWWFIVKLKWHEALLLVVVIISLFRPGFVMDFFYPSFVPLDIGKFVSGEKASTPGLTLRLHIVRETDYGDRLKLYRIPTPDLTGPGQIEAFGMTLEADAEAGGFRVIEVLPKSLAEDAGVWVHDRIDELDVEQVGLPPKQLVYPFGLAVLGIVVLLQLARRRRDQEGGAAAAPASG